MTDQRKDEIDTSPLGEFDRFCRFIDGMHMGGFVENDFMCKAVQKKIRDALLRAESPPVPDDVAEKKVQALIWFNWIMQNCPTKLFENEQSKTIRNLLRAASTPSAEVETLAELHEIIPATPLHEGMTRDIVADAKRLVARRETAEVRALKKIPLSASTSGDFIAPDFIKGWNAALDAITSKSVINNKEN